MTTGSFNRLFVALVAATALAGTLAAAGQAPAASKSRPGRDAAAERGLRVAARECARCHSIDAHSESPRASAPPFRDIRRRYNELSLAREFVTIGEVGHYEMPPTPISKSDGQDLIAFIESLGR